jgi:hypothetical protein
MLFQLQSCDFRIDPGFFGNAPKAAVFVRPRCFGNGSQDAIGMSIGPFPPIKFLLQAYAIRAVQR